MLKHASPESPATLAKHYRDQASKQRHLIGDLQNLWALSDGLDAALHALFADEHFTTLLRAESLDSAPGILLDRAARKKLRRVRISDPVEHLRAKKPSPALLYELGRMVPKRRMESAWMMLASGCFSSTYARALVGASDTSLMVNTRGRPRKLKMKPPQRQAANEEIGVLAGHVRRLSGFCGAAITALFVMIRYAERLLGNPRVKRYLKQQHPEVGPELEKMVRQYRGARHILLAMNLS